MNNLLLVAIFASDCYNDTRSTAHRQTIYSGFDEISTEAFPSVSRFSDSHNHHKDNSFNGKLRAKYNSFGTEVTNNVTFSYSNMPFYRNVNELQYVPDIFQTDNSIERRNAEDLTAGWNESVFRQLNQKVSLQVFGSFLYGKNRYRSNLIYEDTSVS